MFLAFTIFLKINFDHNNSSQKIYGQSFPPFADKNEIDFTLKALKDLNLNQIRIPINWQDREPEKGIYYWNPMDYRIKEAEKNNIKVLLSVPNNGPSWACSEIKNQYSCVFKNDEDFSAYVKEIVTRYKPTKIQFGNEWEVHYAGSIEEFVHYNNVLYDITKQHSPDTKVVLGGITRVYPIIKIFCEQKKELNFSNINFGKSYSAKKLLTEINNKYCNSDIKKKVTYVFNNAKFDFLDIHLYDDAENWGNYLKTLPKTKPIIVSEFGGPSSVFEEITQEYQAQRLSIYLKIIETLPIEEAYYFKLVDSTNSYHKETGLFDLNLNNKKAYEVFAKFMKSK